MLLKPAWTLDNQIDSIEGRLDSLENRLDFVEENLSEKINKVDGRLSILADDVLTTKSDVHKLKHAK